jgi:hypothetical protein
MLSGFTGSERHGYAVNARAAVATSVWSLGCLAPAATRHQTVVDPNPIFKGMTTTDRPKEAPR